MKAEKFEPIILFRNGHPCDCRDEMLRLTSWLAELHLEWRKKGPGGEDAWTAQRFARAIGFAGPDSVDKMIRAVKAGAVHDLRPPALEKLVAGAAFPEAIQRLARRCLLKKTVSRAFNNGSVSETTVGILLTREYLDTF